MPMKIPNILPETSNELGPLPLSRGSDLPTVLDLFAGAGGTSLGFQQAGYRIIGAVEMDTSAANTYERNLRAPVKRVDIRELDIPAYRKELQLGAGDLDVLIGCPPCQGFSRMRNGQGEGDERNNLFLRCLEFIKVFRPRFALFENVPGFLRTQHGAHFYAALEEGLADLGYGYSRREINVADYGVPQRRERVLVVIGRDREIPPFPLPTHAAPDDPLVTCGFRLPWRTVRDAIGHYPPAEMLDGSPDWNVIPNHVPSGISPTTRAFIRQVPKNGGSRTDVPRNQWLRCHLVHDGHRDVFGRLSWNRPSNTITSGCTNPSKGRFVHPDEDRALTVREAAALQGFPDDFCFSPTKAPLQVGNAVPPPLAHALAEVLMSRLRP